MTNQSNANKKNQLNLMNAEIRTSFRNLKFCFFLGLSCSLISVTAFAAPGDVIIRVNQNSERTLGAQLSSADEIEAIIPEMGLYRIRPSSLRSTKKFAQSLQASGAVERAFGDYVMKLRSAIPSDIDFGKQWNFNLEAPVNIRAAGAWEITKGGPNVLGQDVVMALIDGGMDIQHEDLIENLWTNKGEVPDNNVDDDENGFVDDIHGWNSYEDNGVIEDNYHGSHVAGTMAARGENGKGVVGINWIGKLMFISGSSGEFSVVAKAYGYVMKQKQLWLSSGGQKGANVVVTNSSFGVDYADCNSPEFSVWNDIYDEMGKKGILSAAATANQEIDVDVEGDVPTGCTSPYIIKVTNTDKEDRRTRGAAWGLKSIDLGAPGTGIFSTYSNGGYSNLTGTSMATPHVAGAVALMYSGASEEFARYTQEHPAEAALELKKILLSTVDENADLKGKTVTGGRLNLQKAVEAIHTFIPASSTTAGK